jgi:hypothetical protein
MTLLYLCILFKKEEYQIIEILLVFSIKDALLLKRFKYYIHPLIKNHLFHT